MKKLIILCAMLPGFAYGQHIELSAQAGISGNLLSTNARNYHPQPAQPKYKTGGLNPVGQVSFYYLKGRLKIGGTLRHFSTSARIFAEGDGYRAVKFSSGIVQLLHELAYRFVDGKHITFDVGVQGGPAWHSFNSKSTLLGKVSEEGSTHRGFVLGLNFTGRYKITPLLAVNLSLNPLYDLLTTAGTYNPAFGGERSHSTLCLPVTAGIGFTL